MLLRRPPAPAPISAHWETQTAPLAPHSLPLATATSSSLCPFASDRRWEIKAALAESDDEVANSDGDGDEKGDGMAQLKAFLEPLTTHALIKRARKLDIDTKKALKELIVERCTQLPAQDLEKLELREREPGSHRVRLPSEFEPSPSSAKKALLSGAISARKAHRVRLPSEFAFARSNREVVLSAVAVDGWALKFASLDLRKDEAVVMAAIAQCAQAFKFAAAELRSRWHVVRAAVGGDFDAIRYATGKFRYSGLAGLIIQAPQPESDRHLVLAALRECVCRSCRPWCSCRSDYCSCHRPPGPSGVQVEGSPVNYVMCSCKSTSAKKVVQCMATDLRNDQDIMMEAVSIDGNLLQLAARDRCADKSIVMAAIAKTPLALEHALELRADRDVVTTAVVRDGNAVQYAADELRDNRDIILTAVRQNPFALQYAADELRANRDIILTAVRQNPLALEHASIDMRQNREVVTTALSLCCPGEHTGRCGLKNRQCIVYDHGSSIAHSRENLIRYASVELRQELQQEQKTGKRKQRRPRQGMLPACDGDLGKVIRIRLIRQMAHKTVIRQHILETHSGLIRECSRYPLVIFF
eukprot:COSAG01_NODE_2166_length_8254_cov_9.294421_2_plen_586_part_00